MLQTEHQPSRAVTQALIEATHYIFDVDGTLAERQKSVTPELASTLASTGKQLAVATSRAADELDEVFSGCGYSRAQLCAGPIVIEDGALALLPNQTDFECYVRPAELAAINTLTAHIKSNLSPNPITDKWHRLGEIDFPLVHQPSYYQYQASSSLWQQVIESPRDLHLIMEWVHTAAETLGVRHLLQLTEIGDGTLRISAPGHSKGSALTKLHHAGVIDLGKSVYFGDGRNDIPAAISVKEQGGCVIAVDRQCKELADMADFVPKGRGPSAIESLLRATGVVRNSNA